MPATKGNTRRLASLGPLLKDLEARIIDEHGNVMPARGVGVIELRRWHMIERDRGACVNASGTKFVKHGTGERFSIIAATFRPTFVPSLT